MLSICPSVVTIGTTAAMITYTCTGLPDIETPEHSTAFNFLSLTHAHSHTHTDTHTHANYSLLPLPVDAEEVHLRPQTVSVWASVILEAPLEHREK